MKSKLIVGMVLTLLLTGMLSFTITIQQVKASGTIYIKADGSVDPTTANITTADNVTYTFTDNINDSIVVEKDYIVVDGAGYTLQGTGSEIGIYLLLRSNVTIKNMEIKNFWAGIQLSFASNNTISGNNITANDYYGIYMTYASHNTISGNNITEPRSVVIPVPYGIFLEENSGSNIIFGNNIIGSYLNGIWSEGSSNNIISGNTIKDNLNGMWLSGGSNNRIYHNNFIYTRWSFLLSTNTLDAGYPLGGNYLYDYNGTDLFSGLFQNETGSDGIGDTPNVVDGSSDNYPLMGMFSEFNVTSEYHVQTICNSSISDFQYNGTAICFNVTGETDTTGFCRICIPRALMNETYQVFVNGTEVQCNLLPCSNSTHCYLYFTYNHSTQEVMIVPEFPTWTSMLLILIVLTVATAIYKRRLPKTPTH